jgi:metal-dependent amidase/aminoacylase/carboxypeptidase family protein
LRCGAIFTGILSWASWSSAPAGHNAKFDIDESAMAIGTEFLVGVAQRFLESA